MDRLDAMQLFVRIVERGSFTLAAHDAGVPRSTVTQVIKRLEERLGVRLLQRSSRHVSPTLDGEAFYRRCLTILSDVEDAEGAFGGAKPKGLLRVDAQGKIFRHFLLPRLPEFLERHPDLRLHVSEGDRFIDPVREGVDCVLRVGNLTDSAVIARRVAMLDEVTVASPSYLSRYGTPTDPDDLDGHICVGFLATPAGRIMPFEFVQDGVVREISIPSIVSVSATESLTPVCRLGLGLIQAPRYGLEQDLTSGVLATVLDDYAPTPTAVSLLFPSNRQLSPRVRVFADWVATLFTT